MSPVVHRVALGSSLALGLVDLGWLDANAARISSALPVHPVPIESRSHLVEPPASASVAPPIAAAVATAPPEAHVQAPPAAASPAPQEPLNLVVLFDRSLAVIGEDQGPVLALIADALKNDPQASVRISGHADRVPWKANRGNNMTLSDERAAAVVRALGRLGVPSDRIRRVAFGDTRPIDDRSSEEAYRRNRRVEVRVDRTGGR